MNRRTRVAESVYFYHSMPLERVCNGTITPHPDFSDPEYSCEYGWLAEQVGFYPLFLAVGKEADADAVRTTGYDHQWQVSLGLESMPDGTSRKVKRKAGEFPSSVIFAFKIEALPNVRCYNDYRAWHIAMMRAADGDIGAQLHRSIFKRSWSESKWLRTAANDGAALQVVVPHLDLGASSFIWVRNEKTRRQMVARGFQNVSIKRFSCR